MALSALYDEVFSREIEPEYWEWKYYQNPAGKHDTYVALKGDKIVGQVGGIPVKVKVGSEEVLAAQTCDIIVSARHRKGTPFFRLHKAASKEVEPRGWSFVYGFSIESTYRISTKMLGFVSAGPIGKLVKILKPAPFLRNKVKPGFLCDTLGALGAHSLKMLDTLRTGSIQGVEIWEVDRFDSVFDELWRRRAEDFDIMVVRDSTYLNWRYTQNPIQAYTTFGATKSGTLAGFVTTCIRQEGDIRRGYIVDLLVDPQDKETCNALFAYAIDHFRREGADSINTWLPEHTMAFGLAKRVGFVVRKTSHNLIVRSHGRWDNELLTDRSRWFLTMGDSDNY
jgi:hypothetical protein